MNSALITLLFLSTFIIGFLAWPVVQVSGVNCTSPQSCSDNRDSSYGGGVEYVRQIASNVRDASPDSKARFNYLRDGQYNSFDIMQATIGGAVIAVASVATLLMAAQVAFKK